jgi:hypothetical protein
MGISAAGTFETTGVIAITSGELVGAGIGCVIVAMNFRSWAGTAERSAASHSRRTAGG